MFNILCRIKLVTSLSLLINLSLASLPAVVLAADNTADAEGRTLVIGKVSPNPKKHYRDLKPIADYVVSKMADLGYTRSKVLMAKDNRQMIRYLRRGKVDWVTETPFSSMILKEKAGAELLLRKWKKNVAEYHGVFFTRRDSGIQTLADLRGKTIAFEDPGSTSAFYIPADILIKQGMNMVELGSPRETPPADAVGYVFARAEINIATWVHKGIVDAGAYSNLDWHKEDHTPTSFRNDFIILQRSKNFPRAIELVRKDLPEAVKQRLKEVLLHAHEDPAAASALRAYQKTKKFDELDAGSLAALQETRSIMKRVDETLNQ